MYAGLPRTILVDLGSTSGTTFASIARRSNVQVERTGIEAHSSLGIGPIYHQPLRSTYRKIRFEQSQISPSVALAPAVKASNDTFGPEGIVPSA